MVVPSRSGAPGFSPAESPRVAIAGDGTLAAIAEGSRAVVLEIPGGAPFAEIGIDREATGSDVAWVGAPPRLLVVSRYAAHSRVFLIDPHGPRTVAELRLESPMRLFATVGAHALAVGAVGAAVLTATDGHLTPYQFPARVMPVAAGAAAASFWVALAGSLEEWDPASRMPRRRLRLPKPAAITAVGGSDRVVWMVAQAEPNKLEVIPLVNRGQPKLHELPEPIASVAGHPRSDLVVCVGGETGKLYVIDLDGRSRQRVLAPEGVDNAAAAGLVLGRINGVLAAQAGRPIAIVMLDGRDGDSETQVGAPPPGLATAAAAEPEEPKKKSSLGIDDDVPETVAPAPSPLFQAMPTAAPTPPRPAPAAPPAPPPPPRATPATGTPTVPAPRTSPPTAPPRTVQRGTWRDELVVWARAVAAGSDGTAPIAVPIDVLAARLELVPQLVPALSLLYGAHLAGERGAAPVDVARVLSRNWAEALGTGQLARRGLARYADSRVLLAPVLQRALDELPVRTGTLVGQPGEIALLGPCVVVSPGAPLGIAARYAAQVGGAILAAHDDTDPAELFLEARARGVVPMLRIASGEILQLGTAPAVLVVADEATADQLGVPRL